MSHTVAHGPSTSAPSDGSRTLILHDAQPESSRHDSNGNGHDVGPLRLRGVHRNQQRVSWEEDVVDNEGMGKKKTKICCIYHRPKQFDESSDEDSSDSDSDSGSDSGPRRTSHHRHGHHHHGHRTPPHAPSHGNGLNMRDSENGGVIHELEDGDDRNAYESVPSKKGKGKHIPH